MNKSPVMQGVKSCSGVSGNVSFSACGRGKALTMALTKSPSCTDATKTQVSVGTPSPVSVSPVSEKSFTFDAEFSNLSRGTLNCSDKMYEDYLEQCVCNRKPVMVLCRACGYTFAGRVRKTCPCHPKVILLMDNTTCPMCKAVTLQEF